MELRLQALNACRGLLRALCAANLIAKGRRGERLVLYSKKANDLEWLAYEASNLHSMACWFLEGAPLERAGKMWTPEPWRMTKGQKKRLNEACDAWIFVARELP